MESVFNLIGREYGYNIDTIRLEAVNGYKVRVYEYMCDDKVLMLGRTWPTRAILSMQNHTEKYIKRIFRMCKYLDSAKINVKVKGKLP